MSTHSVIFEEDCVWTWAAEMLGLLHHEIDFPDIRFPWMRDPRINDEEDTHDWTALGEQNGTARSATDMDSHSDVEQQCCSAHQKDCPDMTFIYTDSDSKDDLYSGSLYSDVNTSSFSFPVPDATHLREAHFPGTGTPPVPPASCMRGPNSKGRTCKVGFSYDVTFWFPCTNQLHLSVQSKAHCQAALHGVSRRPLMRLSTEATSSTHGPPYHALGTEPVTSLQGGSCRSLVMPNSRSLQGGSCPTLVTFPADGRPPTPPLPRGRWAKEFGKSASGHVIDVGSSPETQLAVHSYAQQDSRPHVLTTVQSDHDGSVFAVFDVLHHSRILRCPAEASFEDLATIAFEQTPSLRHPRNYRVVQHNLAGFPHRQIVIWGHRPRSANVFPIAFEHLTGRICTVEAPNHATALQVLELADRYCMIGGTTLARIASNDISLHVNGVSVSPHLPSTCEHADTATILPATSFPPVTGPSSAVPTMFRPGRWRLPFLLQRSGLEVSVAQQSVPADMPPPTDEHVNPQLDEEIARASSTLAAGHALFTVFDVHFDARIFVRPTTASIWDMVELASQSFPDTRHGLSYRILRYVLPGWPEPQIVVWCDLQPEEVVLPVKAPTTKGVCTVQLPHSASAFAVAVQVCHKCHLEHEVFQAVARQQSTVLVNWQPQAPFADYCLLEADSAALSEEPHFPHSVLNRRGHRVRSLLQVFSRRAFSDGPPSTEIFVHSPCRHSCRIEVPPHSRPLQVMQQSATIIGHASASRLLFLENSPVCYGTPPHAILVDSHGPPDGFR